MSEHEPEQLEDNAHREGQGLEAGESDPFESIIVSLEGHDESIAALGQVVSSHEETIQWAVEQIRDPDFRVPKPVAWSWRHAAGKERRWLWEQVRSYVDWINARYFSHSNLGYQIPPCWYRHPDAVEQLTALWAAWHDAYHDHRKPSEHAASFHERMFWPVMERLKDEDQWLKTCRNARGHEEKPPVEKRTDDGFEAFVSEEVEQASTEESVGSG